jgi:DNA-binding transcriptional MerR regulator
VSDRLLTIGAFARRSRLSIKALRLYERVGLLPPAEIDPHNGYRRYRESQLFTARLIVGLRRLDMPLSEISQIISAPGDAGADILTSYWEWVERRFSAQRELAEQLRESLSCREDPPATFDIHERVQPDQIVLGEAWAVDISALTATVADTTEQLLARAAAHGGVSGDRFVIYHGEVNEDSVGPIEVCIPVASESAATRREPAHRQAYVTVTPAQYRWPQVLGAYDAVEQWIELNDQRCIGSPREIFRAGGVCEVAFPIA